MTKLYLEDLSEGQRFTSGGHRIEETEIHRFAREYDPQPFHLDPEAAKSTLFAGLAASGWHTAAITMRLTVDSGFSLAGGIIGAGFDELNWPRPVRPGDELHLVIEVLEARPSRSKPAASSDSSVSRQARCSCRPTPSAIRTTGAAP